MLRRRSNTPRLCRFPCRRALPFRVGPISLRLCRRSKASTARVAAFGEQKAFRKDSGKAAQRTRYWLRLRCVEIRSPEIHGSYPPTKTLLHSAQHLDGRHLTGVLLKCLRVESSVGCKSVRAHVVENPRWICQRPHFLNCSNARRLSVVRNRLRIASLRWCKERRMEAPGRSTPSFKRNY